jgi:hypothetical protein
VVTQNVIWGNLRDLADNNVMATVNAGAPTNGASGTLAGIAGPGFYSV